MARAAIRLTAGRWYRHASVATYVALFGLVILQLGLALHHDQHAATDLASTCVACVQLEQSDDAVTDTQVVTALPLDLERSATNLCTSTVSTALLYYNGRAPPVTI